MVREMMGLKYLYRDYLVRVTESITHRGPETLARSLSHLSARHSFMWSRVKVPTSFLPFRWNPTWTMPMGRRLT